jgi:predicted small lipoprotein YifL
MKKLLLAGVAALIAVSASACGRMADLDAPPAKATERSMRGERAPGLPEPATVNQPNRTLPIDGGPGSNPYDGPGNDPDKR